MIKTFFSVSKSNMLNFKPMELSSSWELWFFGVIKKICIQFKYGSSTSRSVTLAKFLKQSIAG